MRSRLLTTVYQFANQNRFSAGLIGTVFGAATYRRNEAECAGLKREPMIFITEDLQLELEGFLRLPAAYRASISIARKALSPANTEETSRGKSSKITAQTQHCSPMSQEELSTVRTLAAEFDELESRYQEDLASDTCTKQEFNLMKCYGENSGDMSRHKALRCAELMETYNKCVSDLRRERTS
mmetsp:Transcript_18622/g.45692  ORF Transcript_18622/g.45692 Transcript_18622/m.45692 type:complete len:183 (-) Transcript_18622:246-794(-)